MARPEITVLYITGWCRNGSTILGNVLNEVSGFFHVGELGFLWKNAYGNGSNTSCGCGENLTRCPIWSRVLAAAAPPGHAPEAHARDVIRQQHSSVRTRHTWRVLRGLPTSGGALREHAATLARTYRAIAEVTGCRVIVDSGKLPAEAALLPHVEGISPRFLHLVRDPRAVTHSWTKTKQYVVPMSALRSTAYWCGFNLASEAILRRHSAHSRFLRYEDFIADPAATVGSLLEFAGGERSTNPVRERTVVLGKNHTVTGNPDRLRSGPTLLRGEDDAWRAELSLRAKALTLAMGWPLMRRYGYHNASRESTLGSGTHE
jgi:hypothetical protein